jgi:CBS domain containing-hemolysin-like protein
MTLIIALQLLGGVLLLAANAFFASIEFALSRLLQFDEEIKDAPSLSCL